MTREFAGRDGGRVAEYRTFGEVTLEFDADFTARTVRIDAETLSFAHDNIIIFDDGDIPHLRRISTTFRVNPLLQLSEDANVILARISPRVRAAFQCTAHAVWPQRGAIQTMHASHVATVCERLQ